MGEAPLPGVLGCPSGINASPFLAKKGARRMIDKVFQHPASFDIGLSAYTRWASGLISIFWLCISPNPPKDVLGDSP